jgi:hypothetical protein
MKGKNKPLTTPRSRRYKPEARSSITNGKRLFGSNIDGRSRTARRWRDIYHQHLEQTGGVGETLCRSLASLIVQREMLDATMVRGDYVDPLLLVRVTGAIARTLQRLGLVGGEPEATRQQREREDREAGLVA